MTKQQTLFEIAEIAGSAIFKSHREEGPTELFGWCEFFKDEALKNDSTVSGSAFSAEFRRAEAKLDEKL